MNLVSQTLEIVQLYQSLVMDMAQHELEDAPSPSWASLRPRLLKAFGDRGLKNRLQVLIEEYQKKERTTNENL